MRYLPDEILAMVCGELRHQRDFGTLFNCACSGNRLVKTALKNLYRIQGISAKKNLALSEQRAGFWRAIILSSLGQTLYPYSHFIRTLDLKDLGGLLRELLSNGNIKNFLCGELAQFKVEYPVSLAHIGSHLAVEGDLRLDVVETTNTVGEVVTKQTPLLEELNGKMPSETLSRWILRLPKLRRLKVGKCEAVRKENGALIRDCCPLFKSLDIWEWDSQSYDENVAAFIKELRPQSLESLQTLAGLGPNSFLSLDRHAESLIELNFNELTLNTISGISKLKKWTNLVSLSLSGDRVGPLDHFSEIADRLQECAKLQILALTEFICAPALMAKILSEGNIHLTSLKYDFAIVPGNDRTYQALASQTSLQSLWLKGIEDVRATDLQQRRLHEEDARVLVESLSKLLNLRNLYLSWIPRSIYDWHIIQLASNLPKLEVWETSGYNLTDDILREVASLRSLRRLHLGDLANLTVDGILRFIEMLRSGNKGLVLSVKIAENVSWKEQVLINEKIAQKVDGRFYFTDPSYENFSDDVSG